MIVLTKGEKMIVHDILNKFVPTYKVFVFGSRAKGTKKPFADLDLLISGDTPIPNLTVALLRDAFSESDLPFRVDLLDEKTTSSEFLAAIDADKIKVQ